MTAPTGRKRGPPPGNRNAFKTGRHNKQARDLRKRMAALRRQLRALKPLINAEIKRRRAAAAR